MKKYDIDFKNLSMLNFEELYAAIMKKIKCTEFKHNLTKIMKKSALKELNYQKESLMKNNTIIIHVNNMFLFHQQSESVKKSKSKTVLNAVIQSQFDDLSSKIEILQLNILSLFENLE